MNEETTTNVNETDSTIVSEVNADNTDYEELRAIQSQMSETLKEINDKLKADPEQPAARVSVEDYLKSFIPENYRR